MSLRIGNVMGTESQTPQRLAGMQRSGYTAGPSMGGLQQLQRQVQTAPQVGVAQGAAPAPLTEDQLTASQKYIADFKSQLSGMAPSYTWQMNPLSDLWKNSPLSAAQQTYPYFRQKYQHPTLRSEGGYPSTAVSNYSVKTPESFSSMPIGFFSDDADYNAYVDDYSAYAKNLSKALNDSQYFMNAYQLNDSWSQGAAQQRGKAAATPYNFESVYSKYITPEELESYGRSMVLGGSAADNWKVTPKLASGINAVMSKPAFVDYYTTRGYSKDDIAKAMPSIFVTNSGAYQTPEFGTALSAEMDKRFPTKAQINYNDAVPTFSGTPAAEGPKSNGLSALTNHLNTISSTITNQTAKDSIANLQEMLARFVPSQSAVSSPPVETITPAVDPKTTGRATAVSASATPSGSIFNRRRSRGIF